MKAERKFWTDAMEETVRPDIDIRVNVHGSESLAGMFDGNWYDAKTASSPNISSRSAFYSNMLNKNGFVLGDSKCVLNDPNGMYYTPLSPKSATVSVVDKTAGYTLMSAAATEYTFYQGGVAEQRFFDVHSLRLWNFKGGSFYLEALDSVNLTGGNVLDSYTFIYQLDDYVDEFIATFDLLQIFPNWDRSTYKALRISYDLPYGDRLILAGYFHPWECYMALGIQDIVSIKCNESLELISGEVPHQTMELTIYDEAGNFDPQNPDGQYDKIKNGLYADVYIGVDGAYLSPTRLISTGDTRYDKRQLTIEFDTDWQADNRTTYIPATFLGNIGDSLQQYNVWTKGSYNNSLSGYKTNAVTSDPQWLGELDQLRLSSVGAFAFYNETFLINASLLGMKATELALLPPQDYHITARDMKDSHAVLERKPLLGDVKVTKYNYFISSESKNVSVNTPLYTGLQLTFLLPEWCRHGAHFEMTTLTAKDENGNTIPQASLNWTISESASMGVLIEVSHVDGVTRLASGSLTGTIYYWAQETVSVTTETVNSNGEECAIDNPFVTTDAQVKAVMDSVKYVYGHRDVFTAQWAQDWRVELGDIVYLDTQFESDVKCVVTGLKFSYPGLWGEITMRRLE